MNKIILKPQKLTYKILFMLEKKGLIKTFVPPKDIYNTKKGTDSVKIIYKTMPKYGTHKLICVCKNITNIMLNTHPDNEDFLIINPTNKKFKPLYLIIGLYNYKIIENKAKKNILTEKDILALELVYNNPKISFFTMLKGTPHCEITQKGGKNPPIFFVTEPSNLTWHILNIYKYNIELSM